MISIVIPAHNEEKRIGPTLEAYGQYFHEKAKEKKLDWEIIVVINNTQDRTPEIVKKYSKKYKGIRVIEFVQGGKGFAIIEGFKEALKNKKAELIGFVDADMATSPEAFYDLIKNINDYDGIIASRWKKGSKVVEKKSIIRKLYSEVFNFLVRSILLLNYKDTQCGAKLFKREALEEIISELGLTKWAFDIDLLYKMKRHKFKVSETTTYWEDKAGSHITFRAPIQMFVALIRLRLIYSPFNFVVKAYDKFPEKIKINNLLK